MHLVTNVAISYCQTMHHACIQIQFEQNGKDRLRDQVRKQFLLPQGSLPVSQHRAKAPELMTPPARRERLILNSGACSDRYDSRTSSSPSLHQLHSAYRFHGLHQK